MQPLFEKSRPAGYLDSDYLRPYKKSLPDIFVSKERLPRALDLANSLYRSLTSLGHRVVLAPNDGHHYTRPFSASPTRSRKMEPRWFPAPVRAGPRC